MLTVATISLAIIAATCIIVAAVIVFFIVRLWRLVSRAEAILGLVQHAVPGYLDEVQGMLTKIDREILGDIVRTLRRTTAVVGAGVDTLAQVQDRARRVAEGVIYPPVAAAAGLFAVLREGLTWFRSEGDGKGWIPRSRHSPRSGPGRSEEMGPDESIGERGRDD